MKWARSERSAGMIQVWESASAGILEACVEKEDRYSQLLLDTL